MSYIKQPFQRISGQVTSVAAGTITSLTNVPRRGYIVRFHANLASGTGATIAPVLSEHSGVSSNISQVLAASAAAHVDEVPAMAIPYVADIVAGVPTIYLKHVPNTGSDNVVDYAIDIWPGEA